MKKIFLFLIAYNTFNCYSQLANYSERKSDPEFNKIIRKMSLNDNQYFYTLNERFITLFNIVSDKSLKNKDSLLRESRRLYDGILINLGKSVESENIDIAFWGKESDKNNVSYSYSHSQYKGLATYQYQIDTLLAPDSSVRKRLDRLSYNKYVRHEYDKNGLSILFYVVSKDNDLLNQKVAETDAIRFLVKYIDAQYCLYNQIEIFYIDQYTGSLTRYTVNTSDLILNNLANYLRLEKK